jgi:hypothetical protein
VACIFVRPELFVALVLVTLGVACAAVRGVWRRTWRLVDVGRDVGVVLFLASLPFAVFGNPLAGGRSLFAWSQHYALAQAMQHRTELNPWLNTLAIVTRDFDPVASIGDAFRANPRAFVANMIFNARLLPSRVQELLQPAPFAARTAGDVVAATLVVLAAFAGSSFLALRHRPGALDDSVCLVFGVWLAVAATTLADVLVIHPRRHYLQVPTGIGLSLVSAGLGPAWAQARRCFRARAMPTREISRPLPAWGLVALCGALLIVSPSRAFGACPQTALGLAPAPTRPFAKVRATVEALRALGLTRPVVVLEQGYSYAFYSGLEFDRLAEWTKDRPFTNFVQDNDVGLVVLSSDLSENRLFSGDPEYLRFAADPVSFGFRTVPVPGTSTRIALRSDYVGGARGASLAPP